jgi:Phosphatase-1 catalytic subunit binding region.
LDIQPIAAMKKKTVTFDESKNKVYLMKTWTFASTAARRRYWESFAVDRLRFKRRIKTTSKILELLLDKHLEKIRQLKSEITHYDSQCEVTKQFQKMNIQDKWDDVFTNPHRFSATKDGPTSTRIVPITL